MIDNGKRSNEFNLNNFIGKGKVIDIYQPDLDINDEDVFLLYSRHMEKGINNLFSDLPTLDEKLIDFLIFWK